MTAGVLLGVGAAAVVGWLVSHFAPGVWAALSRRPPVRVHVEVNPAYMYAGAPEWVGSGFVLPRAETPAALGDPPREGCRSWRDWLCGHGAYDANFTEVRITVQGLSEAAVLVDGLLVKPVTREEPVGHVFICAVGGADITPRSLVVNLDQDPAVVSYTDESGEHVKPFAFTLAKGEVETFHIRASASISACRWTASLILIVDGKRQVVAIADDGEPFRTSAATNLPTWCWYGSSWQSDSTGSATSGSGSS